MRHKFKISMALFFKCALVSAQPIDGASVEIGRAFPFVPEACLHLFEPYAELARRAPVTCFEHGVIGDRGEEFFAVATRPSSSLGVLNARVNLRRKESSVWILDTSSGGGEISDYVYLALFTRVVHSGSGYRKVILQLPAHNEDARDAEMNGWTESRLGRVLVRSGYGIVKSTPGGAAEFGLTTCAPKFEEAPPERRWSGRFGDPRPEY